MSKNDDYDSDSMPLVSIAIPSFNHAKYVSECICSVIDQKYENIELLIIDDGSSDDSVELIKEIIPACKKRFTRFEFRARENKGLSVTLNEAIEWAEGKYFSAIASDDRLLLDKTSILVKHIENDSSIAGIFGGCQLIDDTGTITGYLNPPQKTCLFDDVLLMKCPIITPTQLLSLKCLKDVGGYPAGLYIEDWYMWLRLAEKGYVLKVIDHELVQYRQHDTNTSKNIIKMLEGRKQVLTLFAGHDKHALSYATIFILTANELVQTQRSDAFKLLFEAVFNYPRVIFTRVFIGTLLRVLLPAQMRGLLISQIDRIRRIKYERRIKRASATQPVGMEGRLR